MADRAFFAAGIFMRKLRFIDDMYWLTKCDELEWYGGAMLR
jgi:hypothetical protein